MNRLNSLRQKKADNIKALRAIADAAGSAEMTEEQRTKVKDLRASNVQLDADIAEAEQLERDEIALAAAQPAHADTDRVNRDRAASGVSVRDRSEDDPKKGFKDHKDFFLAVQQAGEGRVDKRLLPLKSKQNATAGSDEQSGNSDPYGGFLVPSGVLPGVLSVESEDDFLASECLPISMRTPMLSLNARVDKDHRTSVSGGLVFTRKPETIEGDPKRMKFEQVKLTATTLFGLAFASEEVLQDSPESFAAILSAGFDSERGITRINERLFGTGVGEPLGVMNAGCLVTQDKEVGQGAATIVAENIENMAARCWRYGRSIWIANHDIQPQLASLQKAIGTGGQLVKYFEPAKQDGAVAMLYGRPIIFSECAQTLGTTGDLILGVWREYLDGTYKPMASEESIHVRFVNHERAFKFYERNDGQPWWRTALTPKKSTKTLSPFVALESR